MRAKIYHGCVLLFSMNVCLAMGLVAPESRLPSKVPDEAPPMVQAEVKSLDEFSIKEISPGVLELGNVRLNQAQRSIAFPANVNMHEGPIENLLVTFYGKVNGSNFYF